MDGFMHGRGVYLGPNKQEYEGEYRMDVREGFGTFKWANGMKYVGEWKDNKRSGKGSIHYVNGTQREGLWADDRRVSWEEITASAFKAQQEGADRSVVLKDQ